LKGVQRMAQPQPAPQNSPEEQQGNDAKREVSTIGFPYDDLDGGAAIARAIYELHGSECTQEQIAAHLKQSPKSSGFRTQIATAKMFGLVEYRPTGIALTKLGSQICDSQQEKSARVEAFLNVPLYRAVYENFKGVALPPDNALENTMGTLGVAQKQKERARQVFKRSAQQAGFFQFGNDRLILPAIKASTPAPAITLSTEEVREIERQSDSDNRRKNDSGGGGGQPFHPFIQGLLKKLPEPDTDWPMDARAKWLQAAINIFDLMYTDKDSRQAINIELKKDSAK